MRRINRMVPEVAARASQDPDVTARPFGKSGLLVDFEPRIGAAKQIGERFNSHSDTVFPHEQPIPGMLRRHPGPASGRGGCSVRA